MACHRIADQYTAASDMIADTVTSNLRQGATVLVITVLSAALGAASCAQQAGSTPPIAPHTGLPQLAGHSDNIISNMQLVTISYSGNPYAATINQFGDFIVTSDWLAQVGTEYGVMPGTHLMDVSITTPAPCAITDTQIESTLQGWFADGTLPAPQVQTGQVLYEIWFPQSTVVTENRLGLGQLCQNYVGYHHQGTYNGLIYSYAVIADCGGGVTAATEVASHELIEAATDPYDPPYDGFYIDPAVPDPWALDRLDEDADLCQSEPYIQDAGFTLTRAWSNQAARQGTGSPCVPDQGDPYYNVSANPPEIIQAPAGSTVTFNLEGWSTVPVADWTLSTTAASASAFKPAALFPTLTTSTMNNYRTAQLTLTVPANASSGQIGGVLVQSGTNGHFWPVGVQAQ
jgi:hypothetical protein